MTTEGTKFEENASLFRITGGAVNTDAVFKWPTPRSQKLLVAYCAVASTVALLIAVF